MTKNKKKSLIFITSVLIICLGFAVMPNLVETFAGDELLVTSSDLNASSAAVSSSDVLSPDMPQTEEVIPATEISAIAADTSNFYVGETYQLNAVLAPEGASAEVKWSTSNKWVIQVDNTGKIECLKKGKARIYAELPSGQKASVYISVVNKITSISFKSPTVNILVGKKNLQYARVNPYNSGDTQTWTSSDPSIATVESNGRVTALQKGEVTITLESGSGACSSYTVRCIEPATSVTIDSPASTMYVGDEMPFTFSVSPESSNDVVTWTTTNRYVATVDKDGVVTAKKRGTAVIKATTVSGKRATKKITVVEKATQLKFAKSQVNIINGKYYTNKLTVLPSRCGDTITYTSSDTSVATVTSAGKVIAIKAGTAVITATSGSGVTSSYTVRCIEPAKSVTVNAPSDSLYVGENMQLTATISPETSNDVVTWTTSNRRVATVDSNGVITANKRGTVYIKATAVSGKRYSKKIRVIEEATGLKFYKQNVTLTLGKYYTNRLTVLPSRCGDTITYTSSDPSIATVSSTGKVYAVSAGTVEITATSGSGVVLSYTLTAVPPAVYRLSTQKTAELYAGNTYEITASVLPANSLADQYRLSWTSSDESVAKVEWTSDLTAKITGVSVGTAVITVASPNGKVKYTCKVTVNQPPEMTAINLDKSEIYLEVGDTSSVKGSAVPAESLTENRYLKYYSTNTEVATVDASGNIKAVGVGTAEIVCASDDDSVKSSANIQVFTPAPPTVSMTLSGEKEVYSSEVITLTAAPVPAESVNPIKAMTWKSSDESIARVEAADAMTLTGAVTGVSIGTATITAVSANGVEATYEVKVNIKEPAPEYVTPKEESIFVPVDGRRKVEATVYPETAADRNLHWGSADESIATVDKDGYVTGVATGVTKIMAYACNNVYAEIEVEVIKGGLIYLSPSRQADNSYAIGGTTEYEQMYKVAYSTKHYLEEAGFEVHIASYELKIAVRDEDAASRNAVCYVAIHSNAANRKKRGTLALYYSQLEESMTLADSVCGSVGAITPNDDEGIRCNDKYIEVAQPGKYGIPATLVEVDYHDSKSGAQWIIDNTDALGKSVADGIIAWMRTR